MKPAFNLVPDAVAMTDAATKHDVLASLAAHFGHAYGLEPGDVLEGMEEREQLGSTGFGRGVALPHSRSPLVNRPSVAVLRLERAVEFGSADARPVEMVFGMVSPLDAGAAHLHALAALSRMVRDDALHRALLSASDADALYSILYESTGRDAA